MRGDPLLARTRVPIVVPARTWSVRLEQIKQRRRQRREEQVEVIARLAAEERRARRTGTYTPQARRVL
jgi:hypothetical protein